MSRRKEIMAEGVEAVETEAFLTEGREELSCREASSGGLLRDT